MFLNKNFSFWVASVGVLKGAGTVAAAVQTPADVFVTWVLWFGHHPCAIVVAVPVPLTRRNSSPDLTHYPRGEAKLGNGPWISAFVHYVRPEYEVWH